MKSFILLLFILSSVRGYSQTNPSNIEFRNPSSVATPKGYSQLVEVDLGTCRMLLISGQVALDKQGNLVGKGDFAKQTEQVYLNIKNIVEEAGGTMDHVVKTGIFLLDASQVQVVRKIRDKFVNLQKPPASTLVQVSKLFRDDLLIEIEATAIIPKK